MDKRYLKSEIILIFIFLLAVCIISPCAASDNLTDSDIKVTFNESVYEKDLGYIDVELPENTSGNLKADINNVEFYNENVSSSVKIPISIPQKAVPIYFTNRDTDHTKYTLNFFFNGTLLNTSHLLKVMKFAPDYSITSFTPEILKDDSNAIVSLYFPESAKGEIRIFIDGEFSFNRTAGHFTFLNASRFTSLSLGNHNVTVVYMGDDYYRKFNRTFNFSVVDIIINVPKNIVFEHDDCLSIKTLKNTDGIVYVYVDNQLVFKDKLDKNGELIESLFSYLSCGKHTVEVRYNSSKFTRSKIIDVNASYYVDLSSFGPFIYGEFSQVIVIVPTDFNKDLINLTIDCIKFSDFEIDNSGWIEIDVSRMTAGNHTLGFDFAGDDKYFPWSQSENFTIAYKIITPYEYYFDYDSTVSLILPDTAKGNLEVYINGTLYKSVKLAEGAAEIEITNLVPGEYDLFARYTGDEFNVTEESSVIEIRPDIEYPSEMYVGEDKSIVVRTVAQAKGRVVLSIDGKNYTADVKNGKAVFSLKNIKSGYYDDIDVYYFGDNGFNTTLYVGVDILPSKITLATVKLTSQNAQMKVRINGKVAKNTHVTFKIDKKTKKIKTNKNGIATIALNPGKHTITAVYKNALATKTVNVHVITLKSLSVKKSAKKLVLSATLKKGKTLLKNKKVTFKFNGKTYKARTDKKGIAKVTVKKSVLKKLKVGKKVTYQCSYLKDAVKKTATVKK